MSSLTEAESTDILRGNSLEIYRFLLKTGKPVGIREIQRALNLSSPSLAQYHLEKLEQAGILKHERGSYVINKVFMENCVRVSRFLVPRYLFYSIFAVATLFIELIVFRPVIITREHLFFVVSTGMFAAIFIYETAKAWLKQSL